MSLYVVSANQELLWNVISKNSYIQTFFSRYNPDTKVEWFKKIVSKFYDQYRTQQLTVNDLNRVNKETISYMIQNIREQTNSTSNPTSPINDTPNVQAVNSYSINTPPIVTNNQQEIYANQFEQRQNEYTAMNKRSVPDDVDFAEKNDDGVIENMDILVQQQLKQREYDMNNIPPPINMGSQTKQPNILSNELERSNEGERPKLHIDTDSTINISIQEIEQPTLDKKTVSWKDEPVNPDNAIALIQENMDSITKNMSQLTQTVSVLQNDMKFLQQTHEELRTQMVRSESKDVIDTMLGKIEISQ
jgi:FtsZ-binding cell division protein ZapB